ncbi:VOC family protein, partial [Streptomyces sp. P17]|uniref:VOC family protein n=1 Tax=Streptomyces sp. P17 TaxID=3074716 RepID=UPI0028F4124C
HHRRSQGSSSFPEKLSTDVSRWIRAQVMPAEGPVLYFNQVPEAKKVKNRVHLCLRPETSREQEVERLLGLGATLVADLRNPDGTGWAVLADPEGNEFCVLRSESDRAATVSGSTS